MAAGNIWTRIKSFDDSGLPAEHRRIAIHVLNAALTFRALGTINDAAVINLFSLDTDGQADFTALKTAYAAQSVGLQQVAWMSKLEATLIGVHAGLLTEAQAKSALGVT